MRKFISLLLVVAMAATLFIGCSKNTEEADSVVNQETQSKDDMITLYNSDGTSYEISREEFEAALVDSDSSDSDYNPNSIENMPLPESVEAAVLKGPTAIGMAHLMKAAEVGVSAVAYNFRVAGAADEITADIIKGDIKIAAVPANLASVLYNKTEGGIQVLAINNLGVLYVVELGNEINSVADLKGKTIYTTGKGTTPEYTLRYLLTMAGIDPDNDVTIEFKSEAAEVGALMETAADGENVIAMLPQPYVTSVTMKNSKARVALDVTKEWNALAGEDSTIVTGVIIANKKFLLGNPLVPRLFLQEFEISAQNANEKVDRTAELLEEFDIFKAAVAKQAIPACNITCITGDEMKKYMEAYLNVLYEQNPASIGGKLPDDDFYYFVR